jgi:hypothetical protein
MNTGGCPGWLCPVFMVSGLAGCARAPE